MYSVSQDDKVVTGCFLEHQEIDAH